MFESSLLESAAGPFGRKHASATVVSFCLQFALVGVLVVIPLLYTQALPAIKLTALVKAPAAQSQPPSRAAVTHTAPVPSEIFDGQLRLPRAIPAHVQIVTQQEAPAAPAADIGIPGGVPGIPADRLITSLLESAPPVVPKAAVPKAIQVSQGVAAGMLAHQVKPAYPWIAKQSGVQGAVVLEARISKEGRIEQLQIVSGHPLLAQSAIDAVSQWRYKPYLLNGEPVEVETRITVNFVLSGR